MLKNSRLALIPAIAAAILVAGCAAPTVAEKPAPSDKVETAEEPAAEPEETKEGTRSNPFPLGTKVSSGDWYITIDSVDLDATAAVMDANMVNEAPADGNVYIVVTATTGYTGSDDTGQMSIGYIDYVSAEGNTISQAFVVPPGENFTSMDELYVGGVHTGNAVFEVPAGSAADGVLAVTPDMAADKAFVSVK